MVLGEKKKFSACISCLVNYEIHWHVLRLELGCTFTATIRENSCSPSFVLVPACQFSFYHFGFQGATLVQFLIILNLNGLLMADQIDSTLPGVHQKGSLSLALTRDVNLEQQSSDISAE